MTPRPSAPHQPTGIRGRRGLLLVLGALHVLALLGVGGAWQLAAPGIVAVELASSPATNAPDLTGASSDAVREPVRIGGPTARAGFSGQRMTAPRHAQPSSPIREPLDYSLVDDPKSVWITEKRITWCAAAAAQMVLSINGPAVDRTRAFQRRIHRLQHRLTTPDDGRDAGAGPLAVTASLNQLGDVQYELRIYDTRKEAVRATVVAIRRTGKAALWLAWKGIHAWTISGFRADADPLHFPDARIEGVYVFDPWYPRVSAGWGPSDPPGTFEDRAEIARNFEKWNMPDGRYPDRDGRFVIIVPVGPQQD